MQKKAPKKAHYDTTLQIFCKTPTSPIPPCVIFLGNRFNSLLDTMTLTHSIQIHATPKNNPSHDDINDHCNKPRSNHEMGKKPANAKNGNNEHQKSNVVVLHNSTSFDLGGTASMAVTSQNYEYCVPI